MPKHSWHRTGSIVFLAAIAGVTPAMRAVAQEDVWRGGGPEGGWVIHLSQPYGPGGAIFAGTYGGGLLRSDDGGATWVETSSNARDALVWDVALGEEGTLYAASEDRGVLRLDTGAGDFWFDANTGLNDPFQPFGYGVEIHPGDPSRVSASTSSGVRSSRNRGGLWPDSLIVASGGSSRDLLVLEELPNTIHAVTEEQLLIASGWVGLPVAIEAPDVMRAGLEVPNTLFDLERWPGTTDSMLVVDFEGGLLQLRDRTSLVSIGPEFGPGPYARFYRASVAAGATGPVIRLGADRGLYVSEDVGGAWELLQGGLGLEKPEIWAVLPDAGTSSDLLLGSFVHGVLRSPADGSAPWFRERAGMRATWVRSVDAHAGELLIGTAHGGIFHGTDGETWTEVTGALDDVQFTAVHLSRGGTAWLAAGFGGVYRSVDGGGQWAEVLLPAGVDRIDRFVEVMGPGARILAATDDGLLASDDDGATWQREAGTPTGRPGFALAAASAAAVIAAGFDPTPSTGELPSIWISSAPGEWRELELPIGFRGRPRGLSFLQADGSALAVAATPSGGPVVYEIRGLAAGQEPVFTSLAPGLGGRLLFPIDLAGDGPRDVLVLATDFDGLFLSEDAGSTWREWNEGLLALRTEQIALDLAPPQGMRRRALLGTLARGAWVRESPGSVAIAIDGPWIERLEDAVRVEARVGADLRARLRREWAQGSELLATSESGAVLVALEPLAALRALGATRVHWIVEVESMDGWTELARASRDLPEWVATLRNGLLNAAPNPFNPRTAIRWEQEREGEVMVDLLDLRGRVVRRLIRGRADAGRHAVPWDGTDDQNQRVASGTYIVRLQIEQRQFTERITLIR